MIKKCRFLIVVVCAVLLGGMMTGCGQSAPSSTKGKDNPDGSADSAPVTLKLLQYSANISDEEFKRLIADPVSKKYPNITMELVRKTSDQTLEDIFAASDPPDMVFTSLINGMQALMDLKVPYDLTGLVKKLNMDVNRFDPPSMDGIRMYSTKGELYAIPMSVNFAALFYNKDIFDQFAVPYPKDGMTWEDAIELAKRLTRTVNGVQYRGLDDEGATKLAQQLSLSPVDPKTNKATLLTDGWKRVFEVQKAIKDIPGNASKTGANKSFLNDKTLAMLASAGARIGELEELELQGQGFNWDISDFPQFKEAPGKGIGVAPHNLVISTTSSHKEDAFRVIQLVTSEDAQIQMSRQGRFSSLNDVQAKEAFGADLKSLKGKHLQPLINYDAAKVPPNSQYAELARAQVDPAMNKVVDGSSDINTALREAEDLANQAIASEVSGK